MKQKYIEEYIDRSEDYINISVHKTKIETFKKQRQNKTTFIELNAMMLKKLKIKTNKNITAKKNNALRMW